MKSRKSILTRLLLPNSIIILLVFLVAFFLVGILNYRLSIDKERQAIGAYLSSSISSTDNKLKDMARVSLICYADENTQAIIRDYNSYTYTRQLESAEYLKNLLLSLITIRSDISGVYIFNKRTLIYKYDNWGLTARPDFDMYRTGWFPQPSDAQSEYLSGCKLSVGPVPEFLKPSRSSAYYEDQVYLYMAREVKSFSPHTAIGSILLISPVVELRQTIEQYLGGDSFYLVVDREGIVICEPSGDMTGRRAEEIYPDLDWGVFAGTGQALSECSIGGVRYMAGVQSSDYSGLTFLIGRPTTALFADTWRLLKIIAVISLCAIAVSIALTLLSAWRTMRPLQVLSETMEGMGRNTQVTLPVTTQDETGRLTEAFNRMMETINDLIFSEYEQTIQLQKAQLKEWEAQLLYLRSQINPHFLYNTLDTIRMKAALEGNEEVANLILMLVDFFRFSIGNNSTTVAFSHEVRLMQVYLQLMKQRYPQIIDCYEVDHTLDHILIPSFLLQPLVENSILHGLKAVGYRGTILLRAYWNPEKAGEAVIVIVDDGAGMSQQRLEQIQRLLGDAHSQTERPPPDMRAERVHIGVVNIQERLRMIYPMGLGLELCRNVERGVTARIRIDTTTGPHSGSAFREEKETT